MSTLSIKPGKDINTTIEIPPDKSISHRAVMIASIAEGTSHIQNFLTAQDCMRTVEALRALGVEIQHSGFSTQDSALIIKGVGLRGLKKPEKPLDMGNSGTTMRLLSGILAGQDFEVTLTGDDSLNKRPMKRIAKPLRLMGVKFSGANWEDGEVYPPLTMQGGKLTAVKYRTKVASAQVKSCVLLAGLYANGQTRLTEPIKSRDHTEKMLRAFGARVRREGPSSVSVEVKSKLKAQKLQVPGDISAAAYFLTAGLIVPGSQVIIKDVGINPTRTGILDIYKRMGAKIDIKNLRTDSEPVADLGVSYTPSLKAVKINSKIIPRLIDELPIIMVAATQAQGVTEIRGAKELKVKETDRIKSMRTGLRRMGAKIDIEAKTIFIKGPTPLKGAHVSSFGDHRTAMALSIAGLCAQSETVVDDTACIATSFPGFEELIRNM